MYLPFFELYLLLNVALELLDDDWTCVTFDDGFIRHGVDYAKILHYPTRCCK
jgi:hypothetical protein